MGLTKSAAWLSVTIELVVTFLVKLPSPVPMLMKTKSFGLLFGHSVLHSFLALSIGLLKPAKPASEYPYIDSIFAGSIYIGLDNVALTASRTSQICFTGGSTVEPVGVG